MGFLGELGQYLSNMILTTVKIAYPAYASFKAIKTEGKDDDTFYLINWVVVAIITFCETYVVPFLQWVPFFMLLRLLLYIWLQLPYFNGSMIIFKNYIRPFFEENKAAMDRIDQIGSKEGNLKIKKASKSFFDKYDEVYKAIVDEYKVK